MIITPAQDIDLSLSGLLRTTGLHASDIYGPLYQQLEPKRFGKPGSLRVPNDTLMALGSAWEDRLERVMVLNGIAAYRPKEFVHVLPTGQEIAFSPDLIIHDEDGTTRVGEIKLTSMDITDLMDITLETSLPPKFNKYLTQMMLYIKWLDLDPAAGWLSVMSIRQPFQPLFKPLNITFSAQELYDNEQMCLNYARSEGLIRV